MQYVSIVTAAFNDTYLDGVWVSIKKQTYKKFEWILLSDNSEKVLEWYRKNKEKGEFINFDVWVISLGKNRGNPYGVVTRNIAIEASCYDRIVVLDEDNELMEDDYLESIVNAEKETGKIIFTDLYLVGKRPGSTYQREKPTHLHRQGVDLGNIFYRKEFFKKYGKFDDSKNHFQFDFDLIEAIKNGEGGDNAFYKVNKHLYYRHRRY